eukprot:TRINITY_DN21682_c0_g1_i2.p1 TRINITY_DN21682_c0_g1~~TRINITY_DN21682_c0_g1_i2.p1  ORF type:complete len:250 (+),score=33.07 TRINITY_DN21682_c0_g1_i2:367-1116(+)
MIEAKFNEYGLAISGTGGSSCDKQQPSVKKTALRDLQNENRNIISKPLGNSPLPKVIGPVGDAEKVGSKRPNSDCLSLCNNNTSGKIVYIRRKAEPEPGKIVSCDNFDNSIPPQSRELSIEKEESHRQPSQIKEPKISYFSAFSPIPVASLTTVSSGAPLVPHSLMTSNRSTVAEPNYPMVSSTGIHTLVSPQNTYNQNNRHWEERFQRLQLFLKSCDQSNQEEYIQSKSTLHLPLKYAPITWFQLLLH